MSLVVHMPHMGALLLAPVVPGDDEGYAPFHCQAADIVGILVEGVPQEGAALPRQAPHLPCYRRVVRLRVIALHLLRLKEGHPFVVPLVPCLDCPALDNDVDAAFVVCDGCEVRKARVQGHDACRGTVFPDDPVRGREDILLLYPIVCDDLYLVRAAVRDNPHLYELVL